MNMKRKAKADVTENDSWQDVLIKNEVETAISVLQAIYEKERWGELLPEQSRKIASEILRLLTYGSDGYFWADTIDGVNVVLYGRKDVEGRNRLEDKDLNGKYYVKELLATAKAGGGYVEYWFPKKGGNTALAKRSYVFLFEPFGWVVG